MTTAHSQISAHLTIGFLSSDKYYGQKVGATARGSNGTISIRYIHSMVELRDLVTIVDFDILFFDDPILFTSHSYNPRYCTPVQTADLLVGAWNRRIANLRVGDTTPEPPVVIFRLDDYGQVDPAVKSLNRACIPWGVVSHDDPKRVLYWFTEYKKGEKQNADLHADRPHGYEILP